MNRIYGTEFTYEDRKDIEKSKEIAELYLRFYGFKYQEKTGNQPTLEIYARIWNGGAYGWRKQSTLKYWEKVKKEMEK